MPSLGVTCHPAEVSRVIFVIMNSATYRIVVCVFLLSRIVVVVGERPKRRCFDLCVAWCATLYARGRRRWHWSSSTRASRRRACAGSVRSNRTRCPTPRYPTWSTSKASDWLHGFPGLFTDTSEHIRFYFVVFLFSTIVVLCCRLIWLM